MRWCSRPLFLILAWLALIASQMPTPAWSCSVTGRVGDETAICRGLPPGMKCCTKSSKPCCQPLSFPPLPFNSDDSRSHNILAPIRAVEITIHADKKTSSGEHFSTLATPAANFLFKPARTVSHFATAPPFLTLHRPASLAPRAPPVALLS